MEPVIARHDELALRDQLLTRRARLASIAADAADAAPLTDLLAEVDRTLERFDHGTFGVCEVCHGPIEHERLAGDPLVRVCLECLSATERRALERDLDLAGKLQRAMLPPRALQIDGWEAGYEYLPAGPASGDYVDLLPLDSGELMFMIGDVSGKGVAASLLMSHLHATLRSLVALGLPFHELVERTNRIFYESVGGRQYATLVCGRAAPSGEIELANAGHCPPIVVGARGAVTVPPTSVPVGLFSSAPFPTRRMKLDKGDRLLVYTDGVSEAVDVDGREYGATRLMEIAEAGRHTALADLIAMCVADVNAFRGEAPRGDDVTVFALRRRF